jgi:hypothetical protein
MILLFSTRKNTTNPSEDMNSLSLVAPNLGFSVRACHHLFKGSLDEARLIPGKPKMDVQTTL